MQRYLTSRIPLILLTSYPKLLCSELPFQTASCKANWDVIFEWLLLLKSLFLWARLCGDDPSCVIKHCGRAALWLNQSFLRTGVFAWTRGSLDKFTSKGFHKKPPTLVYRSSNHSCSLWSPLSLWMKPRWPFWNILLRGQKPSAMCLHSEGNSLWKPAWLFRSRRPSVVWHQPAVFSE